MQAIETKYLPATNTRGSRIKATCERGSLTIPYPHGDTTEDSHRYAVKQLVAKFVKEDEAKYNSKPEENTWSLPFLTGGGLFTYVHVFVPRDLVKGLTALQSGERGGWVMGVLSTALDELKK
jgi:hypothetical protein